MPAGEIVWKLTISHRHGQDTSVYSSEEDALDELAGFAFQYWDEALEWSDGKLPEKPPADRDKLIDMYFGPNGMGARGEYYEIEEDLIH